MASIDPGLNACGVAVWDKDDLVWAGLVQACPATNAMKWKSMAEAVWFCLDGFDLIDDVILELPQVYRAPMQKGDQNDLVQLAAVVGAIAYNAKQAWYFLPRQWKKQVPKAIMVERIKKCLGPSELANVLLPKQKSLAHNIFDSIGLGLWRLGRLK